MDNFEALIRLLLERENHWTRQSQKVELSNEVKRSLGKPSMPRVEIDVIAFNPGRDEILAVEVKSYMDSLGVQAKQLIAEYDQPTGLYKVFTCKSYRSHIEEALLADFQKFGLATSRTKVKWGLAAGKIKKGDAPRIVQHFKANNWELWTPDRIASMARALANIGYENDPFVILSKLLVRNQPIHT